MGVQLHKLYKMKLCVCGKCVGTAAVSTIAAIDALHWGGASASAYGGSGRAVALPVSSNTESAIMLSLTDGM